nr:immunoglobulin heavy chain junction region [Macaca mulatta]
CARAPYWGGSLDVW